MSNYEFGAGIWMFQQFVDRYATDAYGPPVSTPILSSFCIFYYLYFL